MMRRGHLNRKEDVSKVSGTGRVAEIVMWSDEECAIHWTGAKWPTTTPHPGGAISLEEVHGHDGETEIVWDDPPEGWYHFGAHIPIHEIPPLEFSEERDEDGDPLWERPYRQPIPNTKEQNIAFRKTWDRRVERGNAV